MQVGSPCHFAEATPVPDFDHAAARGWRLDIAAGTAGRFEPGQAREVCLVPVSCATRIYEFNQHVTGALDGAP
ncbi:Urease subunit beta 1 [Maliponia aquimaris]|uniref:Urease subunit beta 1 n=1 Tax=Maliponia aquimaris TaxID=1673631 RepID=A0A238K631_9RHOB|nr:Urease subunit beta 1 [Maliponia aquimaris]